MNSSFVRLWRLQVICHSPAVALLDPIKFPEREKLEVLQRLDRYRKWRSLEEKRYCLVCGKVIAGHDIQVIGGTRGAGPLRVICSTRGCHSIPMDWVLPTDEVLAKMSTSENQRRIERPRPQDTRHEKFAARLGRFAIQFRRAL
jgi:hypothetical protein